MKKHNILSKTIAAAASLALCATAAHAATLLNGTSGAGELLIGFRATGSTGATTNVVIDVGSASSFAAQTAGSTFSLGNIGSDLAATYGANWYNRTDVLWSAVSGNDGTDISTNTLYGGVSGTGAFPLSTVGYTRAADNTQSTRVSNILSAAAGAGGFTSGTTGSSSNVALEATAGSNSWTNKAPGRFGGFSTPSGQVFEQAFTVGALASGVEGALDVYRMVRQSAVDPDNGLAGGAGTYQFTVTIDSTGALTGEVLPVAVPEPASIGGLFSAALLGIGAMRRKRGAKTQA